MQVTGQKWRSYFLFGFMILLGVVCKSQAVQRVLFMDDAAEETEMTSVMTDTISDEVSDTAREAAADAAEEFPMKVAITFDDGPHPSYTKKLLDGLKERGVKATFFVVGENIPGREEIIEQMYEDGHLIGNHTWDHSDISKMSVQEACAELQKTSTLVKEVTGSGTAYVRAPFGNWDDALNCETTMISVKWTVDTLDWTTKNVQQVVNKVVDNVKENDIILLHDYYETSVEAALQIIDILQNKGFVFVTVEDLLLE